MSHRKIDFDVTTKNCDFSTTLLIAYYSSIQNSLNDRKVSSRLLPDSARSLFLFTIAILKNVSVELSLILLSRSCTCKYQTQNFNCRCIIPKRVSRVLTTRLSAEVTLQLAIGGVRRLQYCLRFV